MYMCTTDKVSWAEALVLLPDSDSIHNDLQAVHLWGSRDLEVGLLGSHAVPEELMAPQLLLGSIIGIHVPLHFACSNLY